MPSLVDDYLTVGFWSVTYLLIVFAGYRSRADKQVSMPYIAGVLNFAWEICSMYWKPGFWGYILWFAIDITIVWFGFCFLDSARKRFCYIASIVFSTLALLLILQQSNSGFIYSVYIIDLLMAICYLAERKKLSPTLQITIGFTRLLGDFFAGFVFCRYTFTVVIAIAVLICNCVYVYLCIRDKNMQLSKNCYKSAVGNAS